MTRTTGIVLCLLFTLLTHGQGGDQQVRAKANGLFEEKNYVEALPLYSQLVSLSPGDRVLNYRLGTCMLFGGVEKDKAIGHLKFATQDPAIPADAWYWLGRAYHLSYLFKDAQAAYQRYQGTGSKKELEGFSVAALDKQCRNGQNLLSNLKEITVRNKVEVDDTEFFRFYELGDIGGRIVVLPDELRSQLDKKSKQRTLVYIPDQGGRPIYFASYGKDGKTGRDIYRTELLTDGKFAVPVKLAGYINTDQDEDFAFLHADGKNFYFSSKGHNSMGGYDVFRSTYDKGLDTFGPPENLDFAVNTPDDDVFYMTDGENKEACFASGRDSKQGKLHVYRVATAQVPVVVTVLKGTYASVFDKEDRKAHIIVEDAVTRERVADVRTDINGSYVLALPRSGQFRFAVDCGPSGKTHLGMVDIPRSTGARAYRQELELIRSGDLEKLEIRNYFDTPLDEDMIALMMEEIKRRARLDITSDAPAVVAEQVTPPPAAEGDLLTKAGFSGDVTEEKAVQLAKQDAAELDRAAYDLDVRSEQAFAIAIEAASQAERTAREAETLANASTQEADEATRNARMSDAAALRQRSRAANLRARSAYRTGQDLEAEQLAVQVRATKAAKLATDLERSFATQPSDATLEQLRALKERLDTKSGPDGDLSMAERARRQLTEQEKEAARLLNVANAKRAEENEFADRIARSKRERDETKSKSRKEELSREITQQEQQLAYLHDEVEGAFTKAREQGSQTAVLRGQRALTEHLSTTSEAQRGTALNKDQLAGLGQRIAGNDARIASIPIDERFDAQIAATPEQTEAMAFNWELNGAAAEAAMASAATTQTQARNASQDATSERARTIATPDRNVDQTSPVAVEVPEPGAVGSEDLAHAGNAIGEPGGENGTNDQRAGTTGDGTGEDARTADEDAGTLAGNGVLAGSEAVRSTDAQGTNGAAMEAPQGDDPAVNAQGSEDLTTPTTTVPDRDGRSREDDGVADGREESATTDGAQGTDGSNAELATFLLQNEQAELEQALAAERDQNRRDSLTARIADTRTRIADRAALATSAEPQALGTEEELSALGVDMDRVPVTFYPETKEADIIAMVYTDFEADKKRIEALPDAGERADGLSGLETMLADSLRGELVRQAAILELAPQQGPVILPKMERLRVMRQDHLQQAERIVREQEMAATEATRTLERPHPARDLGTLTYAPGTHPINDRFIALHQDPQEVYASKVVHRSAKVDDAVAFKDADLARMLDLDQRIDSIEAGLDGLPRKEFDKQRREADKLIDERMIIRADLGQRSAFLTKEEWRTANDSMRTIEKRLVGLGLAPNENLVLMAGNLHSNAKTRFAEAEVMRKKADRSDDILVRDSLFRTAYTTELEALAELDKAITVKTYLVSDGFQRGESLSYDEIARRVLNITDEVLLAQATPEPTSTSTTSSVEPQTIPPTGAGEELDPSREPDATATTGTSTDNDTVPTDPRSTEELASGTRGAVADNAASEQPTRSGTTNADDAGDAGRARRLAEELADRTVAASPASARQPLDLYERFLGAENVVLKQEALDPQLDPTMLALKAERAGQNSAALEQRSLELADKATALEDSAATARKRDREELMRLASRTRIESDSLHTASVNMAEEARALELQKRDAEQALALRERLVKYYYLTSEEQAMVIENADQSRYFQAKARALEQYDAASEAEVSARINRELSESLRNSAEATNADVRAGRMTAGEADARRDVLYARAEALSARADSLGNVAARLRGAAGINENQASVMLQGLPADRSTEWMALEMRTRRTEALLARNMEPERRSPIAAAVPNDASSGRAGAQGGERVEGAVQEPARTNGGADVAQTGTSTSNGARTGGDVNTTDNGGAARTTTSPNTAEDRTARNIAAPFGTDSRSSVAAVPRPIAEVPALPEPFPTQLVTDIFDLRPAGERGNAPIPMDARMPEGLVFKVQIGAFRNRISEAAFSDMTPVMGEHTDNGFVRYTAGLFTGFAQAAAAKDKVRDRGYRDAFVVAYRDGVRVPLAAAMREARAAQAVAAGVPGANEATAQNTATAARPVVSPATSGTAGNTVLEPARTAAAERPAVVAPPVSIPAVQPPTTEQILARYPSTAAAIVEAFQAPAEATSYYNVPGAAPADQVETIRGLFYTVQVGVYSKPVPLDKLFNITPLNSERTETAKVRYTTGRFMDPEQARVRKEQAVVLGVKDAFITAYLNGKRIPMQEAAALVQRFGAEILAKP